MKRLALLAFALTLASVAATSGDAAPKYPLGPDSLPQEGVPRGRLEGPLEFRSRVFPGTVRRYWIHVPAQYTTEEPACLLVFQDGQRATNPHGSLRVPQVMDNLIQQRAMPVTIGLFITPGHLAERYPDDLGWDNPNHRAQEYDALSDSYARMLLDELLPAVGARYRLTDDPEGRAIGGTSSGAICAFTVAWHRPDAFRKVISLIGSYTSIAYRPAHDGQPMVPGGDLYPTLIRKNPIRPLRIFLQDGSNDLSNEHGNWFLANQQMLSALEYANRAADERGDTGPRYDVAHRWDEGVHSDDACGYVLPDALRWIWRDSQE